MVCTYFLQSLTCLFIFLSVSAEDFNLDEPQFVNFFLAWSVVLMSYLRNICLTQGTGSILRSFGVQACPELELKYIIEEKSQISELLLFSLQQLHSFETCFIVCTSLWSCHPELLPPRGSVLFQVIKGKCSLVRTRMGASWALILALHCYPLILMTVTPIRRKIYLREGGVLRSYVLCLGFPGMCFLQTPGQEEGKCALGPALALMQNGPCPQKGKQEPLSLNTYSVSQLTESSL